MNKKLRIAIFKLIDLMVIFTMVFGSPMSITASALAQDSGPALITEEAGYETGDSARITGSGFAAGEYVLAADRDNDDDILDWGSVTVNDSGVFVTDSPALDADGAYEVRAYASEWSGDWEETPIASTDFTVSAPPLPTETPTEEPTATEPPTAEPTLTQTEEPTATESPTEEPTNTSTEEPTAEPTNTSTEPPTAEPTNTSTDEPTATEPPTVEPTATSTDEPTGTPTEEPTVEPTNTPTTEPTTTTEPTVEPTATTSPTIESGQADYPQGALVTLTGTNWQGDTEVRIIVNDDIGQTWRRDVTVSVAADGTISDSFNLPSFFVATFTVVAKGLQTDRVAVTSFTDAPKITAKTHQGQEKPSGTYTSGNITTYQEGDLINFRFTLESNEPSSGQLQVRFTGNDGTCLFFDGNFTLGTHDSSAPAIQTISGATPVVTTVGTPVATAFGTSNGEWVQTLNITFSGAGEAVVNYYLQLSDQAGECNGSSQHSRLSPAGGDVGQSGQQNVPVPANQIVELPEITVTKRIDRDGNGSFESTAAAGEFCFTLDGGTCVATNSSGEVTFINVTPNGAHTITETQLNFSQGTYSFISGSGTNCTFSGSTATATVASGTTSTNASCIFNNGLTNGTLTIVKVVVNDNGGTKQVSDFPLFYNGTPATSGVPNTVSPGTYTVTETQQPGYTAAFSGDCNSSGVVTVGAGQNKTCTITNNDQPATLIVIKHVINDNGGTATAADFTLDSGGTNDSPDNFPGAETPGTTVTLDAGSYNVTETGPSGYSASFSADCSGSIAVGQTKTCTVTNDDNAATLIVIKHVVNDNGGTATASSFTMSVTGINPSPASFVGAESPGTTVTIHAGSYSVSETGPAGYTPSYSADCSGTITNGQTKTCTVTNDDQPGTLIVKKVVINDNGGTLEADDFSFSVNGGAAVSFEADGQNNLTVDAGTYTVTEPAVSGYSTSYNNCTDVVIPNGGSATCTITNNDQAATLIVKKVVVNDNGGALEAEDFSFEVNGGSAVPFEADGQNNLSVSAGTYTVTEPAVSGYTTTYENCSNLVIPNGGTATCTVTNNDQPATLIVKKVVITDNGGTATADDFSFQVNGGTAVSFEADGQNDLTVNAGTYTVTEPAVAGYTTTYDNCSNLVIPNGGTATCTITNDDQAATLIVKKVVVNNNGGTLEADDFSFSVNGGAATPFEEDGQNDLTVNAGTYTVTEPSVAGYTTTYNNCSNLVIPNGGSATCTITNDDQAATLFVIKHVVNDNGGTAEAGDFTMTVNGTNVQPSASFPGEEAPGTTVTLNAGSYSVSETNVPGYTSDGGSAGCSGSIANGETKTCTFTNNDDAPSLTLVKTVVNDNGGTATAVDFILSANGPTPISGAGGATSDASFEAGTYDLSETNVPGYSASAWSCQGGNQTDEDTVEVGLGENVTCTITNDDDAPSLTLVKQVTNDNGGTATAASFTLSADGPTSISGAGGATSDATFDAGTYDLSETMVPGYTASDWSCEGGNQTDSDTVQVGLGDDVTCTITNNDDAPSLTLVKVVVNDNGGTATAAQWTLTATGPTGFSGAGPSVSSDASFDAGTYALSESGPAGYTASDWVCEGGTQNGSDITLELGESATCTITNNDNAPSLTLVKVVVNDNGGTAADTDFNLSADGPTPISGAGGATSDATFDAGTYDLSETGPDGYSASDWDCEGGNQTDGDTISLGLGESATCTITNDDQAPSLTLVKVVTNNDGGDAVEIDWTLTASGPTGFSGPGPSVSSGASFEAGTYTLSESGPAGYTASAWSCDGGTQNGSDITVALGESATCTITNDDVAPTLKLVKVVSNDNGGNNAADDWVLYATASAPNDGRNFSNMGGSGVFETVFANVEYDLSESVVAGYTAGSWSCSGGTLVGSTITLAEGQTGVTCTITNDDSAPTLTLIKTVVNNDGGDAVVADFPLFINGDPTTSGQSNILSANTLYTASETTQPGYTASVWGGDCAPNGTITLSEGQNATCTITNDDVAPTLKLVKVVVNDNGGNAVADDWTLSAATSAPFDSRNFSNAGGSGVFETVFANQGYDLSETTLPGYIAGAWSCDGGTLNGSTITLAEGENITCTITNDDVAPQLRLVKIVVNDDGGDAIVADFPLFIDGSAVTSGAFVEVTANDVHSATETNQPGYTASAWGGDCNVDGTVTLNEGEVKTCTITNDDVAPTLKLVKEVNNDNGGNGVADHWTLSAAAGAPFDGRNFSNAGGSGVFETVFANAGYDLSETMVSGYTAGNWVCDGGTLVGSTVTLDEGETEVTCTITNDDSAPTLTLIKVVVNDDGGNAAPNDFNLTIGGNPATSGTAYTLDANTPYAINETLLSGYSFVSITGAPECPSVLGGTVTLDEGENITCTITNDDIAPTLTLIKNVINDHGGNAEPDDFNLTIGGAAATSGVAYPLDSNTPYAIDETLLPGYSFVNITGDPECPAILGGTVTLDEGENVTCTITNDDQAATLVVIKHVVNDNGGTSVAGDFTLDSGGTDDTPNDFAGEEAPGTTITLDAGSYNVTETGPSGYSATFSTDCSGTIANGETKTCTVTNDDVQPQLIVIKHVINDNGGTAEAGDFTMEVTGNNVNPGNFPGAEAPGTNVALDAGSYSVAETGPSGYAQTFSADCTSSIAVGETKTCTVTNNDISPTLTVVKVLLPGDDAGLFNLQVDGVTEAANVGDNGTTGPVAVNAGSHTVGETAGTSTSLSDYVSTISGDCAADGTVSLALAENKTCTITNIRRGSIVVVKNALGGDGTFDFTSSTLSGFSLTTSGGTASTTFSGLDTANTYDVAETVPAGWELNSSTCDSGEAIDSIDLEPGETVTCTFENEKSGSIVIIKNTVGGDGTFDFTSSTLSNFSLTTAGNTASTTFSNLDVDITYDVTETIPAGWDLTSATCDSAETVDSIDLEPGETVTCTFTNTKHGHIIVDKVTLPSGDTQSFTFTTTGSGYTGFNLTDAAAPNDQTLPPGVYSVTETVPAGWDLTGLSCTDPSGAPVIVSNKATINLAAGETVNCTFTNTKRGTITIVKDAVPNHAQDFAFTTTGTGLSSFMLDDDPASATPANSKTFTNLLPGAYSVTEGAVAGWDLTGLTCNDTNGTTSTGTRTANIALDPGENVTCTFTNTKRGTIIVEKQTNPDGAPGTFTFTGTAAGTISDNGTITVANLVPGTYTSTEANPAVTLFALTSIVCNDSGSANPSTGNLATRTATFELDPGETVKCVFTNTKDFHAGTIGFWKNWRNHYTSTQAQLLVNYLKSNNPKIYNKDLVNNNADDFTIAKWDVIFNVGTKTPREQMILAQFTALKLNLAITQLDGTDGLVQKNDNLCTAGIVDVSGISGATAFFGTSTPTVGQIVTAVENRWTGKLTTNRSDWKWNLTNAQKDTIIKVVTGINEGTLVMSSGCP